MALYPPRLDSDSKQTVLLRLNKDLYKFYKLIADQEGVSVETVVAIALTLGLSTPAPQVKKKKKKESIQQPDRQTV